MFLAAAAPVAAGETALDLGCGVGTAALCLLARVPGARAVGVELQPAYAALAAENAAGNALPLEVVTADLRDLPPTVRARSFDHVLANPPFFAAGAASGAADPGRDAAQREGAADLAAFLDAGLRRLRPGGALTLVHRAERLGEILAGLAGRAGAVEIKPLAARAGRPAERVVVRARKGARAPLALHAALVIHAGAAHGAPGDGYTAAAEAVLRHAQPLVFEQNAEEM